MSGNGSSSLGTLLFSVPLAAIPLMAIFGIPQFAPLVASPERTDGYERGSDDRRSEDRGYPRRAADVLRSRGVDADLDRNAAGGEFSDHRNAFNQGYGERSDGASDLRESRPDHLSSSRLVDERYESPQSDLAGDDAPPFHSDERRPARPIAALTDQRIPPDAATTRPAATAMTWQSAAQRLQDLGINSYHLEPGSQPASFLFVCSFCPAASPNVTMRFEAEAVEPLDAVDDVLAQIDRWQQQQVAGTAAR